LRFMPPHPRHKNKDVPRMGHPVFCVELPSV
jgi:hypothetical protein